MKHLAKALLITLGYVVVFYGIQIAIAALFVAAVVIHHTLQNSGAPLMSEEDVSEIIKPHLALSVLVSSTITIPVILGIQALRKVRFDQTWLPNGAPPLICGLIVLLACSFNIALQMTLDVTGAERFFTNHQQDFIQPLLQGRFIIVLLAIGIMAPVLEEIIFRGCIFTELRRTVPLPAALVLQAVAFGLIHLNPLQTAYATLLGLLLGVVYMWFRSIWAAMLLHICFNSFSVIFNRLAGEAEFPLEIKLGLIVGGFALTAATYLTLRRSRLPGHGGVWEPAMHSAAAGRPTPPASPPPIQS
ncbi:CPBP family intramembrane metalloprotease [Candidatus Sumerlaeota bacterium]|nr:CPBP family intramembrane metalloprotease [Candidatus Sumerlaeota bacterium]